jgi:hypothetical protein
MQGVQVHWSLLQWYPWRVNVNWWFFHWWGCSLAECDDNSLPDEAITCPSALVSFEWSFLSLLEYTGDSVIGESVTFMNAVVFLSQLGLLSARLTGNYLTSVIVAPRICCLADRQLHRICRRLSTVASVAVSSATTFIEWWNIAWAIEIVTLYCWVCSLPDCTDVSCTLEFCSCAHINTC